MILRQSDRWYRGESVLCDRSVQIRICFAVEIGFDYFMNKY